MFTACLTFLILGAAPGKAPSPPADTVVVCSASLRPALAPWLALREQQGHVCRVIDAESADAIRRQIRGAATDGKLKHVVLVGDAPSPKQGAQNPSTIPTHYVTAQVIHRFGGERSIAGDNWYADLDDDRLPDIAIGRLPADSAADLAGMIEKIIAYERGATPGVWRRRINLVAGLGGFGAIADAALEASAKRLLIDGVPAAYATNVTYGSWRSPYCPDPQRFHEATLDRFNEGSLFWVYIGHGHTRALDRLRTPDGRHHIFAADDCAKLKSGAPPIALLLCCSAGGFDQPEDCVAEELVRATGGPVAALAGSRVTMPYAMSVLGAELLRGYFEDHHATLGDLFCSAKRGMMLRSRDDERSRAIDALAQVLNPASKDLQVERAEHLDLFNLIGDPLLRLPQAAAATIQAPAMARPGETIEISGTCPVDGNAEVELVVRRDRLTFRPPVRANYDNSPPARDEYQRTYAAANDTRLALTTVGTSGGKFTARLAVPDSATRGACHVRVLVLGQNNVAVGSTDITIEPAQSAAAPIAGSVR